MPANLELWITANDALKHDAGAATADRLYRRLKLVATLLDEVPNEAKGPRLIWRKQSGGVETMAVDRLLVIGRDPKCDLVLDEPKVSRRHCTVTPAGRGFALNDLGSTNGTKVNSALVQGHALQNGDVIEVGRQAIAFVLITD